MRVIIIGFIAAVCGVMAWFWFQPVCEGGTVVADEAACVRSAGFRRCLLPAGVQPHNRDCKGLGGVISIALGM